MNMPDAVCQQFPGLPDILLHKGKIPHIKSKSQIRHIVQKPPDSPVPGKRRSIIVKVFYRNLYAFLLSAACLCRGFYMFSAFFFLFFFLHFVKLINTADLKPGFPDPCIKAGIFHKIQKPYLQPPDSRMIKFFQKFFFGFSGLPGGLADVLIENRYFHLRTPPFFCSSSSGESRIS